MSFDSTMKFRTDMTRAEIERMLVECRMFADAMQMQDVVQLLTDTAALSAVDLQVRLKNSIQLMDGNQECAPLIDKLDMLLMNAEQLAAR